jgi:glycosyltransferase involved in cell wall biosynthesis
MARRAWKLNADAYHASDLQPLPFAWIVSVLRRKPLIYEAREISTDREAFQGFSGLVGLFEGFLARRAEGFITTTQMRAEYFEDRYGLERVTVVQNRPPYKAPVESDHLRKALALGSSEVICLYQGGLQQGRGLPELLRAATEVPNAHFVLLGAGLMESDLKRLAKELELEDRVHFLPPVPFSELHAWTASADVGVQLLQNTCLNHYTTDSNKLFEYAMAGLPVVASDFPEIRAILDQWGFGIPVDPADHERVVAVLKRITQSHADREMLSAAAKRAAKHLDWASQKPALLEAYARLFQAEDASPRTSASS